MSGVKDPFEILADEITLIRRQIDQLQRTSLDRKKAEHLNAVVASGLNNMAEIGPAVQQRIERSLATAVLDLRQHTVYAATEGPRRRSAKRRWKASRPPGISVGPPERPVERPEGGLAGSGYGWPLWVPQARSWASWRCSSCKGTPMPTSSGKTPASFANRQAAASPTVLMGVASAESGSKDRLPQSEETHFPRLPVSQLPRQQAGHRRSRHGTDALRLQCRD